MDEHKDTSIYVNKCSESTVSLYLYLPLTRIIYQKLCYMRIYHFVYAYNTHVLKKIFTLKEELFV